METDTAKRYREHLIGNYGTPTLALVRGEGSYVWDDTGKHYLDFGAGIAVNGLGHAHPHWVARIAEQAATMAHCSNLYAVPLQAQLAETLSAHAPGGKWLFCNSGAEANEALIKLARLHGVRKSGEEGRCYKIVTAENSFHGRTMGALSATPQQKVQQGFAPLLKGFAVARLNDLESFAEAIDEQTAAVLIEPIQGEGGLHIATPAFLNELRALCTERGVLLMLDEVQCGVGRTGTFFAHEAAGIRPDAIALAKGLGGGFPVGGIWVDNAHAELFTPGSHGTTFGGNPLACAAALAVLEVIERESLLEHIRTEGTRFLGKLQALAEHFPKHLREVRGRGLMLGLVMEGDSKTFNDRLREGGLLAIPAGGNVLRLLPPLNAQASEIDEACAILEQTLATQP